MLFPYRRHTASCPHARKGQAFTLCECPIWAYGSTTPGGDQIRRSLQTRNWPQAVNRIEALLRGDAGLMIAGRTETVETCIKKFLVNCHGRGLESSTIRSYENTLAHLAKAMGSRLVSSVDLTVMDGYRTTRQVKPRTWRKELETLRAFFAFCLDREWTAKNPAKKLRMPLVSDLANLPFTENEVRRLLVACDQISSDNPAEIAYIRHRARALIYTLLYTGLRIGDVGRLRRSSLDESSHHLTLRTTKTGVPIKVLLHPDAARSLATLPAQHPDYFFWTGRGDIERCGKNMWRTICRLGKLASVDAAHPHRFRDTFAVELLTSGADIRTVQKLLGHDSVRTTEKHYAHFVAAHQALLDDAVTKLDFEKPKHPVLIHKAKRK